MRLWSLHPQYLDARGLVAVWREALLAQAVLRGRTTGYRRHPQLDRFRARPSPVGAIAEYLRGVHAESVTRGYVFASGRISRAKGTAGIPVTRGQVDHEWQHLLNKLAARDPPRRRRLIGITRPQVHPLFRVVPGRVESWGETRMNFDSNSFMVGMIAGAFGVGYFAYGKKQNRPVPMACGVLLMVYPYFTDNIWILLTIGVALCLAPLFVKI